MDARRKTLASWDPNSHGGVPGSGIPVPASALKKNAFQQSAAAAGGGYGASARAGGGRFSMAPQRAGGRASIAPGAFKAQQQDDALFGSQPSQQPTQESAYRAGPSQAPYTAARPSTTLFSSATAHRMTLSAGRTDAGFLRSGGYPNGQVAPTPGTVGRGSLSISRRKSATQQPGPGGYLLPAPRTIKDPRPKDKRTLAIWQTDLFEFLKQRNYAEALSAKTLQTPTTKDFQNIFRFLYNCIDPTHKWGQQGKKFEDEVIPLLKNVGYPCVDTLSKSGLQAAGSIHSWPTMLAMLHWMYVMMDSRVQAFEAHPPLHLNPDIEVTPGDEVTEAMASVACWYEYIGDAYPLFLQSDEYDFEPQKIRLEERFQAKMERDLVAVEQLEKDHEALTKELERLRSTNSKLEATKTEHDKFTRDIERFRDYIEKLQKSAETAERNNKELEKSLKDQHFDLDEKKKRSDELQVRVNAQKISSSDVHKMNADRNKLQSNTKAAADRHQELFDQSGNLEIRVQNVSDGIEKLITVYKTKAFALELMPRGPAPFEHVDFSQALNGGASDLADMVPDPQAEVRPALARLKKSTMDRRRETGDQVLAMEEKLTTLAEAMVERKDLLAGAEAQVDHVTAQLNEVKEAVATEVGLLSQQADNLQRQNQDIKFSMTGGLLATEQRLEALRLEHDELVQQVEKLKKENVDEFASMLEFFVEYKSQCADKVAALQQHAEGATA